ncbi:MAG: DUF4430 domain-containing protein [Methanobacteriota archaeon]
MRRWSERRQAVLFAAVLVIAILGTFRLAVALQAPAVRSLGPIRASLVVDGTAWQIDYVDVVTTNNTAFGILLEASERLGFEVLWTTYAIPAGVFVTAINGTANGAGGMGWQYWVSGAYGSVAADRRAIVDGDVVLWRFAVAQEGS